MNMLFEGLKEKGAMVIVPSSAVDTMNLGAMFITGLEERISQYTSFSLLEQARFANRTATA